MKISKGGLIHSFQNDKAIDIWKEITLIFLIDS